MLVLGFYFYKANWNPEPMLHLCGKRMIKKVPRIVRRGKPDEKLDETIEVIAFSNVGDVTLFVNGRKVGTKTPDAVKAVEWKDVALETGLNEIAVEAGGRRDVHLITKTEME